MSRIGEKARHVRAAGQERNHVCHWPGCNKQCKPAFWGCSKHWFTLPLALRNRVWKCYQIGQEQTGRPSPEYVEVARQVQAWASEYEAKAKASAAIKARDLFDG